MEVKSGEVVDIAEVPLLDRVWKSSRYASIYEKLRGLPEGKAWSLTFPDSVEASRACRDMRQRVKSLGGRLSQRMNVLWVSRPILEPASQPEAVPEVPVEPPAA